MAKRIITYILCLYFLAGSAILPMGDFCLLQDLPAMYHSYEQLVSADEKGVLDFVGDYLLGGRDIFGHNKHDVPENGKSAVQFQHASDCCSIVLVAAHKNNISIKEHCEVAHSQLSVPANLPGFFDEPLRPPHA
ncbi:hypothetical protein [Mucilaginibacter sp. UR6-11]|uniref:hypothetical protein n=1 Tax=Mucilaginibacter sp. UR6-11 TaxID=1435644 RepID=UPI001E528CCD|nr:hypothetical protein [Mucilaginibacter sp. UR6-11]MCC8427285.1 hypothetical protein [Mucilaginibacter sp. UR6-11]